MTDDQITRTCAEVMGYTKAESQHMYWIGQNTECRVFDPLHNWRDTGALLMRAGERGMWPQVYQQNHELNSDHRWRAVMELGPAASTPQNGGSAVAHSDDLQRAICEAVAAAWVARQGA